MKHPRPTVPKAKKTSRRRKVSAEICCSLAAGSGFFGLFVGLIVGLALQAPH
jgi:hypothetical protein